MTENGFGNLKKSETEVHKVTLFLIFFSSLLSFLLCFINDSKAVIDVTY